MRCSALKTCLIRGFDTSRTLFTVSKTLFYSYANIINYRSRLDGSIRMSLASVYHTVEIRRTFRQLLKEQLLMKVNSSRLKLAFKTAFVTTRVKLS